MLQKSEAENITLRPQFLNDNSEKSISEEGEISYNSSKRDIDDTLEEELKRPKYE